MRLEEDIVLFGMYNADKKVNWVGVTHDNSIPKGMEEAAEVTKIYVSATNAIISLLGDEENMDAIYQSINDQRYKESKDEAIYITNGIKYVETSTAEEAIFIAMNEYDNY